jgi:flagellar hook-basal body complex protein FliE
MSVSAVGGVRADIAEMLSKIRDVSNRSPVFSNGLGSVEKTGDFGSVFEALKSSVGGVSDLQAKSESVKNAYLLGDPNVSLSQVIVSSEKSKLAFEGLVTVRNKCLEAYKEIMNMPV